MQTIEFTKQLSSPPTAWGDVEEAYEFWSFLPPLKFSTNAEVYHLSLKDLENFLQGKTLKKPEQTWVFYIKKDYATKLEQDYPQAFNEKLGYFVSIPKYNTVVLIEKKLLPKEAQFGVISHEKK